MLYVQETRTDTNWTLRGIPEPEVCLKKPAARGDRGRSTRMLSTTQETPLSRRDPSRTAWEVTTDTKGKLTRPHLGSRPLTFFLAKVARRVRISRENGSAQLDGKAAKAR